LRNNRSNPRLADVTGTRTEGGSGQRRGRKGRTKVILRESSPRFTVELLDEPTLVSFIMGAVVSAPAPDWE
jgi:hypothetical protein